MPVLIRFVNSVYTSMYSGTFAFLNKAKFWETIIALFKSKRKKQKQQAYKNTF